MVNVRRGINIRTSFAIQRNGIPEDLSQAQNMRVVIRHKCQPNSAAAFTGSAVKIEGNSVSVVVTDTMQKTMASGDYIIEVAYRLNNPSAPDGYDPYIIDSDVFTLTDRSADVGGVSCGDVTVQVVNISGEVSFCSQALEQLIDEAIAAVQAANEAAQNANDAADAAMAIVDSKVDIDGLNANVKRLQFDTTNPTAPMQIGQIAWDNDEQTLVTHDGLHTHPLGKELELRARNTSGATILNGRACYVTGSTGDNPTIALATNTNGDVAQKTIGVATMDIANNAFGIVTTFGEVNGVDTSALTLGAIVYLGANGLLTTTEPVAPTPKIVIGLCVRQHAQVGKLFVSTRPIARLSKLSEVHAPVLTDNDVLRYNGTTLRWEVYSLAGKADLVGGKVPSAQLPAYVDDVLEYANLAAFPATGESGKIYVALNTNLTYRWSGTAYVEISKSLALGETSDTAYRGDRGKTAYDHSQTTGNPHGTTAAQIPNVAAGSVSSLTVQGAINELAGDIVQVETDLNIKNAEQDASIKSIEQLLSQSNMNQTAQVSSSGREIISLPKTASNGGMDIKLEGLTATQLVENGNFAKDINSDGIADGWSVYGQTGFIMKTVSDNTQYLKSGSSAGYRLINPFTTSATDLFYLAFTYKTSSSAIGFYTYNRNSLPSSTSFTKKSFRTNLISAGMRFTFDGFAENDELWIKNAIGINLTATFGAGNEPDLATCDAMFSTYFEGTKSFIPTGRLRSVGKNLFDKNDTTPNMVVIANGTLYPSSSANVSNFIPIQGGVNYYLGGRTVNSYIAYYDKNYVFISSSAGLNLSVLSPTNAAFIRFSIAYVDMNTCIFSKGTISSTYEPYKSTKLYLTAPELKSNGNVKDEIRKGANGYEFVKRVGVGTLGAEKVLNGGFDTTNNWTVPSDRATITNGTLNIDVTSWGIDVRQFMSFTAGKWYFVKFNVTNVVRGGILYIYGVDNAIPISVGSVKEYTFVMKASTTADNTLKINSANIAISIDNVSVKEITTSDGDLTGTTAVIYDTNINYTLATRIVTPIEHAGVLNSAESGTVYHEPVLADAAIYGTNISILNTTYPISSLEEIMVHTNVDTYLDVSKAVIASDGLSFTHPDLRAGDLVLFTYFFSKEKVNGLITATYYDGRYVIADTSNGKFYKWGVKSTNGVATIQLTEV